MDKDLRAVTALVVFLTLSCATDGNASPRNSAAAEAPSVTLAQDGKAAMPIYVALPPEDPSPAALAAAPTSQAASASKPAAKAPPKPKVSILRPAGEDLKRCLDKIMGAEFKIEFARIAPDISKSGIYVGRACDFPNLPAAKTIQGEQVLLLTGPSQVFLIGVNEKAASNAVYSFLDKLGCRWYFPGAIWEVLPKNPAPPVALNETQAPDFPMQRMIWMGHGMHTQAIANDMNDWIRRNRMGSSITIATSHNWPISPDKDFETHPEWFSLTNGQRIKAKPCYSNPEVIARGIEQARRHFLGNPGAGMVSASAPDGPDFCTCDLCKKQAKVQDCYGAHGAVFGKTADGTEVSLASETIFNYANKVAEMVEKEFPGRYVGILAYSWYSHPPTFPLRPNIYVETTSGFRNTPMTRDQQLTAFGKIAKNVGIYEYFDVEQWSWDLPGSARASKLDYVASAMTYYHSRGITSLTGEMSNNWGPNGIGYYLISRLLWNNKLDARAVEDELYRNAFGPAAEPMKRFYQRWESGQKRSELSLLQAYKDLKQAAELTANDPTRRARVDALRLYAHFLNHYVQPPAGDGKKYAESLGKKYGPEQAKQRVEYLGNLVRKLMDTHMTHSWAFNSYLAEVADAMGIDTRDWKKPAAIPTGKETEEMFAKDLAAMDLSAAKDIPVKIYSRDLVPAQSVSAAAAPEAATKPSRFQMYRSGSVLIPAKKGQKVEAEFLPGSLGGVNLSYTVSGVSPEAFLKGWEGFAAQTLLEGDKETPTVQFEAPQDGVYKVSWRSGFLKRVNCPAVLNGDSLQLGGGDFFFFVPKGTPRLLVRVENGAEGAVTIRDAKGNVALQEANPPKAERTAKEYVLEVPPGADNGIWMISGPNDGMLYSRISLVGVPGYLSLKSAQLLVPREVLK